MGAHIVDEALETISSNLNRIKEEYGPEAVHISSGFGQKVIFNIPLVRLQHFDRWKRTL